MGGVITDQLEKIFLTSTSSYLELLVLDSNLQSRDGGDGVLTTAV